ncbi:MAG: penicillin acylase family protein [Vicinamibacteria bacterium]
MKRGLPAVCAALALTALLALDPALAPPAQAARPLREQVLLLRDIYGVPHIRAESDAAAGFGLGYAQAEDHAEDLARRLLRARGEAARALGPAELESDLRMRRADNLGEARRQLGKRSRGFQDVLRGFAEGVNLYAAQHRSELPEWIPEFTAADVLAHTRAAAVQNAFSEQLVGELRKKYPEETPGEAPSRPATAAEADVVPSSSFPDEPGSNALALAGSRTVSGRPLLLANPHLRWSARYWEAHVTIPGRLDFYGSTLVGFPWLRAGFGSRLGYVQTNNAPDLQDVLALRLDPEKRDHYLFDGRSQPLRPRDVAVEVRQPDGSLMVERRRYWESDLGPIVHRTRERAFAVKSAALDAWGYFEGFHRLSHARDLAEFLDVLSRRLIPSSNFTYADAAGNVLYLWNARLPRRPDDGTDYALDVAADRRHVWTKLHRTRELPRLLNPRGGAVQNANNPPWYASRQEPLDPARYPSYVERGPLSLRAQAALAMLDARERFAPEDVIALKYDTRMRLAERVRPALLAATAAVAEPSSELRAAAAVLSAWDGHAAAQSEGAVLFEGFWRDYARDVEQPYETPWSAADPYATPRGLSEPAKALRHLEEAVRFTRERYGSESVAWGDVHRFRLGGLDLPGEGASGQLGLYRVMGFDDAPDGKRVAGAGSGDPEIRGSGDAWVLLVDFSTPVRAQSVLAYGQSARAGSPHAADQIELFAERRLRPVFFSDSEVAAHLEREYRP